MAEAVRVSISETGRLARRATVSVPAEQFEARVDAELRQAAGGLKVPGFRPGKVPMKEVRRRLEGRVRDRVAREMSVASFKDAMRDQPFTLAAPAILEVSDHPPGADLEFAATFDVLPEIELAPWASLRIRQPQTTIEERDIDSTIEDIRSQRRKWAPVDRPAAQGDRVTVDYRVRRGDMVLTERSDVTWVLGEGRLEPLENAAVGLAANAATTVAIQTRALNAGTAPSPERLEDGALLAAPVLVDGEADTPEAQDAEGAGEPGEAASAPSAAPEPEGVPGEAGNEAGETLMDVTMRVVEAGGLPAVDDALFDWFGVEPDGDRAAKFRAAVRERMDAEAQGALQRAIRAEMRFVLAREHSFELPSSALAEEFKSLGDFTNASEETRAAARRLAESRLRARLVMREIVKRESLRPDETRVRARIERIASAYEEADEVRRLLMNDERRLREVEELVLEEQLFEHIAARAQVVPVAMDYQALVAGQALPELPPTATDAASVAAEAENADKPATENPSPERRRGLLGGLRRLFAD